MSQYSISLWERLRFDALKMGASDAPGGCAGYFLPLLRLVFAPVPGPFSYEVKEALSPARKFSVWDSAHQLGLVSGKYSITAANSSFLSALKGLLSVNNVYIDGESLTGMHRNQDSTKFSPGFSLKQESFKISYLRKSEEILRNYGLLRRIQNSSLVGKW